MRVTERAAVAAARFRGRGDERAADQAAVDAMRRELNQLPIDGTVVIGEGERDEAPMLYIGEEVGTGNGPKVDIALDPLEGTTICAKNLPNALAVIAIAEKGGLLNAPDVYMEKIAIGPGYPEGDRRPRRLDGGQHPCPGQGEGRRRRPRSPPASSTGRAMPGSIEEVRATGAAIRLIGDGDVAGVIHTTEPERPASTSISASAGRRKACWRRRRCAASAARCRAGSSSIRRRQRERARQMGITDISRKLDLSDMARATCSSRLPA